MNISLNKQWNMTIAGVIKYLRRGGPYVGPDNEPSPKVPVSQLNYVADRMEDLQNKIDRLTKIEKAAQAYVDNINKAREAAPYTTNCPGTLERNLWEALSKES